MAYGGDVQGAVMAEDDWGRRRWLGFLSTAASTRRGSGESGDGGDSMGWVI
jgi:hypothetical protein